LLLLNIVLYSTDILHVDDQHSSYLLAALSLGIGIGSFLAGYASAGKIEHGMVLPGMIGILAMSAILASPGLSFATVAVLLALLGTAGGLRSTGECSDPAHSGGGRKKVEPSP